MADAAAPTPDYDYSLPPESLWSMETTTVAPNPPGVRLIGADDGLVASLRLLYVSAYSVALLLGLPLNLAVIVAAFRRKTTPTTPPRRWSAQVLGLAATHLARCLFLPLSLLSAFHSFSWEFGGAATCKLASYVTFVDMFSAALIVTFWHARRVLPVRCLPDVAGSTVLLSWFLGAVLAAPSLLSMEVQEDAARNGTFCVENYDYFARKRTPSAEAVQRATAVMATRFLFGLALPVVVIAASRFVAKRRGRNADERESAVLWPVTVGHFVCWAPALSLSVLQVAGGSGDFFVYGLPVCTVLHVFNSCVCPAVCLWKGKEETDGYQIPADPREKQDEHDTSL